MGRSILKHDFQQQSRQSHAVTVAIDSSHCRLNALDALVRRLTRPVVSSPLEADTDIDTNAGFASRQAHVAANPGLGILYQDTGIVKDRKHRNTIVPAPLGIEPNLIKTKYLSTIVPPTHPKPGRPMFKLPCNQ